MKKLLLIVGCLFSFFVSANAQVDKEKAIRPKGELKIADLLYAEGHYYSAAEYYKEYLRVKPNDRYAKYWLGMVYLKAADYNNAVLWFENFKKSSPGPKDKTKRWEAENKELYSEVDFYYGVALKQTGNYSEAVKYLEKFKSSLSRSEEDADKKEEEESASFWHKKASIEILGAQMGLLNLPHKKVIVENVGDGVNSGYSEAAPVSVNDTLIYYSSLNQDQLLFINKPKDIPPYRMYQAVKKDGAWEMGKRLPRVFNDEAFGTGNAALSEDGQRMYFCKCLNIAIDEVICNLYFSEKKGERWSEPEALNSEINSPKFTATQPTVRTSGDNMDIVYFVSDREGGKGGMDIWYFIRTANGNYKGPRPLGGNINTEFDELTPYYDNTDNLFYFSSDGHPSYGGFDIFVSKEDEDLGWIAPSNIGQPMNSPADDLYYTREQGKTSGFLVSNREGTSKIKNRYVGDDIFYFEDMKFGLEGFVFMDDKSGTAPLEGSVIELYADDAYGNEVLIEKINSSSTDYFFELKPDTDYKVVVKKPGFSEKVDYVSTMNLMSSDTINKNLTVNKTSYIAGGGVYSDEDSLGTNKLTGAIVSLAEKMPDGTLRSMTAKKLTETNPEFYLQLDANKDYVFTVVKDGFFKYTKEVSTKDLANDVDTLHTDMYMSEIKVGKTYELENVLYDFGSAKLREESEEILDGLVTILQENPGIIIELAAHTDNVGSDKANLYLSQDRAQSCVDYLKSKGIGEDRMIAKGYGESVPIAPNENPDGSDNPEGRQKNRRTEFKVIGGL